MSCHSSSLLSLAACPSLTPSLLRPPLTPPSLPRHSTFCSLLAPTPPSLPRPTLARSVLTRSRHCSTLSLPPLPSALRSAPLHPSLGSAPLRSLAPLSSIWVVQSGSRLLIRLEYSSDQKFLIPAVQSGSTLGGKRAGAEAEQSRGGVEQGRGGGGAEVERSGGGAGRAR